MKKSIILMCSLTVALLLAGCNRNTDQNMSSGMSSIEDKISSTVSSAEDFVSDGMSKIESGMESTTGATADGAEQSGAKITAEQAKQTALKDANLSESDVTGLKVEFENDDGALKYDVDFSANGKDYDYDIDATNGEIISSDKDND